MPFVLIRRWCSANSEPCDGSVFKNILNRVFRTLPHKHSGTDARNSDRIATRPASLERKSASDFDSANPALLAKGGAEAFVVQTTSAGTSPVPQNYSFGAEWQTLR
jgi:hypothetical protein